MGRERCSALALTDDLIDAAGEGDQMRVQCLLRLGADVNGRRMEVSTCHSERDCDVTLML